MDSGQRDGSEVTFIIAAEQNDADAQAMIGEAYALGKVVAPVPIDSSARGRARSIRAVSRRNQ
jgi:hypothetical protein